MAHVITDDNFQKDVIENEKVTLIDLWAEWCGPCKLMGPVIDELAVDFEGKAVIGKLDVDTNPKTTEKLNVRGIPTFILYKNGEIIGKVVGITSKKVLAELINQHI